MLPRTDIYHRPQDRVDLQMRLVQGAGSPLRLKARQGARPDPSAALFLVKRSTGGIAPAISSKISPGGVPERRLKKPARSSQVELSPAQQGQASFTGEVMAAGLLGWLAHAVGVWLQHR